MNSISTTTTACTFATFRDGSGGGVCRSIGIDISGLVDWASYAQAVTEWHGEGDGYSFEKAAEQFHGEAFVGERAVLLAALAAANLPNLADRLSDGRTWDRLCGMSRRVRESVAAAILRID